MLTRVLHAVPMLVCQWLSTGWFQEWIQIFLQPNSSLHNQTEINAAYIKRLSHKTRKKDQTSKLIILKLRANLIYFFYK